MRLDGRIAVITGTANGIGRAAALRFAEEGAAIVGADVSNDANSVTTRLVEDAGGKMIGATVDVTDDASVAALFAIAEAEFGRVDIVFNNAGVMLSDDGDALTTPDHVIDRTLAINVKGVIHGCRHGIPALRRAGGGSIINTASFVATVGAATPQIAYTASKGAVLAMTREIAAIYARQGIRANSLCPGPVLTPLLAKFLSDDAKRQRRLVHIPMGRFGEAAEMVNGALFLASDESSYMTGQSLLIDGGITSTYTTPE
jgi:NAD(P)-dependent dehydrogenase (short-subunit alcohol dehydrogenase family)